MFKTMISRKNSYSEVELYFDTLDEVETFVRSAMGGKNADEIKVTLTFESTGESEW